MLDARMQGLHRAALAIAVAMCGPLIAAGAYAGDWKAVWPFLCALLCAAAAMQLGTNSPLARFLAAAWPLVLWPFLYTASVEVVQHYPDRYIDHWLAWADRLLLYGRSPDTWALGGPQEELANLLYLSYYVVIPGGALWAWWRFGPEQMTRYTLGILAAFTCCALAWLVVPAGGYHPDGSPNGHPYGPFTAVMRAIYDASPHYAAAFPSSHVALAFASSAALSRLGASTWIWLWAGGVAWSTVQGQYHYVVDSPPAMVLGVGAAWWAMSTQGIEARSLPVGLRQMLERREPG